MIIEAVTDGIDFKGKKYPKGAQKNVLDDLGAFLVKSGHWKYLKGAHQTEFEAKFYRDLRREEEE